MFGFLKDKIKNFVQGLTKKEEEKTEPQARVQTETNFPAEPTEVPQQEIEREASIVEQEIVEEAKREVEKQEKTQAHRAEKFEQHIETPKHHETVERAEEKPKHHEKPAVIVEKPKHYEKPVEEIVEKKHAPDFEKPLPQVLPAEKKPAFELREEKRELKPQLGLFSKIKSVFTNKITITEAEAGNVFDDLRIALLEADVSFDTADFLVSDLHKRLIGREVEKNAVANLINAEVGATLTTLLSKSQIDFLSEVKKREKPVKILFLGPNGAGKTTTIAKLVSFLKENGLTSVISASDVFRAAAIEQAVFHGEKLGVKVIKHKYGADPTAVAFDAIEHAKAQKIDCVLIDTAGRQETNFNLIKEMEKMNRVIKPDLKIFIGEAIAGHALVEQVKKFNDAVGIDAIILTKLDCDAKGGTSLSLAYETHVPIAFIGVGQEYADLRPFDANWLVKNIVEN